MYEEDEVEPLPSNLLPTLNRFKWYIVAATPLLLLCSLVVILILPSIYRAPARVMVETQQIPSDLVQSTVTAAASEQIDVMRQRVMTRDNLLAIMNKYDYFGLSSASPLEINLTLEEFRGQVALNIVSTIKGRTKVAIGFLISFGSKDPAIAQAITNDLVSLFLSENVKARTERASETTEFLVAEAGKIRAELDQIEATVAEFKRTNKDNLPEHLGLYVEMREDTRKRINENERMINGYQEQIRSLTTQLTLVKEQNGGFGTNQSELVELKKQLRLLQLKYQPNHPDVLNLRDKINLIAGGGNSAGDLNSSSAAEIDLENQIAGLKDTVTILEKETSNERSKLEDLEQRIIKIPQVERGFVSIKRDYEAKSQQYETIVSKTQSAEMAESLEQERKAERFILLEPPVLPTTASQPNKKKLLLLAFGFSLGLPIGVVGLMGLLDNSVRSRRAVELIVGENPLIEIPYIEVPEDIVRRKKYMLYSSAGALAFVLCLITIVQVFVMPLDTVMYKTIEKFGMQGYFR
ncbi:MAG: hypothetical protein KTR17_01315 [Cellvibrionaceae bacterium]|nr:hypothetical protein [Cellvibrionaceae bacterium]